jgi:hypothetical protein
MSSTVNANSSLITMTLRNKSKTRLESRQKPSGSKCNLERMVIVFPYNPMGTLVYNLFRSVLFCNLSDCTGTGWLGGIDQAVAYVFHLHTKVNRKQAGRLRSTPSCTHHRHGH